MVRKTTCLILLLLVFNNLNAAEFPIRILGREVGLEKANFLSVMQDRAGFLWFSTQTGLYQYAGSYTKKYVPGEEWGMQLDAEFFYKTIEDPSGDSQLTDTKKTQSSRKYELVENEQQKVCIIQ